MRYRLLLKNILLLLLVLITLWFCTQDSELQLEEGMGVVMDSEWEVEGYNMVTVQPSELELKLLPVDTTFKKKIIFPSDVVSREEAQEKMVHATIVLSGADTRSIHRPEICLPSQGWTITSSKVVKVSLSIGDLSVMQLELERSDTVKGGGDSVTRAVYSYFLVGKDIVTSSTFKRIMISNWDNLVHNKAHRWAYPSFMSSYKLQGDGADDERDRAMRARLDVVMKAICPQILKREIIIK